MKRVIALAANYGYLDKAETTLKSIFKHTPKAEVYLANMDIPQEWFVAVNEKLAPVGSKLHDLKIDLNDFEIGQVNFEHINDYSYVRIYLPRLIEADRILYLDSDIIVRDDLNPFLELELAEGKALAMVKDIKYLKAFSSGVILFDCARWQSFNLEMACRQILRTETKITNGDQTVINLACRDFIQELPPYYNNQVGYDIVASHGGMATPFEELLDAEPLIVHYLTEDKPWKLLSFGRQRALWWAYRNLEWSQVVGDYEVTVKQSERPQILIFTRSDQLNSIDQLVTSIPEADFIIAAFTLVSNKVKRLLQYPNVRVQYITTMKRSLETAQKAKLFLDLSDPIDGGVQAQLQALAKPYLALKRPGYENDRVKMIATPAELITCIRTLLNE